MASPSDHVQQRGSPTTCKATRDIPEVTESAGPAGGHSDPGLPVCTEGTGPREGAPHSALDGQPSTGTPGLCHSQPELSAAGTVVLGAEAGPPGAEWQEKDGVGAATGLPGPGVCPFFGSKVGVNCTARLNYWGLANMPLAFHHSTHLAQKPALWEGLI